MNYYEELGIKPDADEEEIRKAHRRLVKLMHPDHQRDPSLKLLAETQMRRLNSIVATLLNAEERQDYDDELRGRELSRPPSQSPWRSAPWWIASTLVAVLLTVGGVWFWADHLGSSFGPRNPVYIPPQETSQSAPADAPERPTQVPASLPPDPPAPKPEASTNSADPAPVIPAATTAPSALPKPSSGESGQVAAIVRPTSPKPAEGDPSNAARSGSKSGNPKPQPGSDPKTTKPDSDRLRVAELSKSRASEILKALTPDAADKRKVFSLPAGSQVAASRPAGKTGVQLPPPPGVAGSGTSHQDTESVPFPALPGAAALAPPEARQPDAQLPPALGKHALSSEPLVGEWVYSPKEPEKHKPGFYPPQFVSLSLRQQADGVHGQYSARYDVSDNKPISPDVSFQLKSVDKTARKFVWQSGNGSRGTLSIRPVDDRTILLEWRTTVFSGGPALTSGTAMLVRRSQ